MSLLNYFLFFLLLIYIAFSTTNSGLDFFLNPINYGAIIILFYSLVRMKNGFLTSKTPTIKRSKIQTTYFKTPKFSYPRLEIYFEGPEGKILKRTIATLYSKEALPILKETGLLTTA